MPPAATKSALSVNVLRTLIPMPLEDAYGAVFSRLLPSVNSALNRC